MKTDSNCLKIVFMGTPEFAVVSLEYLCRNNYNIAAVVTAPDKPSGRGRRVNQSEIKRYSLLKGLKILQPEKLNDPSFVQTLREINPDIIVVVAFRMLPETIWKLPPLGTFNLHASLLPQYRGAAPINRAVMNGEKITGITTFFIDHQIDTGNIIMQETIKIDDDETAGELHDRMKEKGAIMVASTIELIAKGEFKPLPQSSIDVSTLKTAPKIFRNETKIDWNKPANDIRNHIRGLSPYPAAYFSITHPTDGDVSIKVFRCNLLYQNVTSSDKPQILTDKKNYFRIALPEGTIDIQELQMHGRKRMSTAEFLRGFDLNYDWKLVV